MRIFDVINSDNRAIHIFADDAMEAMNLARKAKHVMSMGGVKHVYDVTETFLKNSPRTTKEALESGKVRGWAGMEIPSMRWINMGVNT